MVYFLILHVQSVLMSQTTLSSFILWIFWQQIKNGINGITVGYAIRLEVSKFELKDNFLSFFVHLFIVYH